MRNKNIPRFQQIIIIFPKFKYVRITKSICVENIICKCLNSCYWISAGPFCLLDISAISEVFTDLTKFNLWIFTILKHLYKSGFDKIVKDRKFVLSFSDNPLDTF